jgi:hypothetical protein
MSEFDNEEESVSSCESPEISEEESWETLKANENYEISTKYPHRVCKKSNGRIVKESDSNGYLVVTLDGRQCYKHRLIAEQFIENPNPEEFKVIDHINGDRGDNHISNLRWTTQKQNCRNKHTSHGLAYELVDSIPEEAIVVDKYSKWSFEFLYFHEDKFYFYTGLNFRILRIQQARNGTYLVNTQDVGGKFRAICYNKFKREYGLI